MNKKLEMILSTIMFIPIAVIVLGISILNAALFILSFGKLIVTINSEED